LREVFDSLEDPQWNGGHTDAPLKAASTRSIPLKKITTPEEKLI
jgi:putative proteasome-type protease